MTRKQIDAIIGALIVSAVVALAHLFIRVDRLEFEQRFYHGAPVREGGR